MKYELWKIHNEEIDSYAFFAVDENYKNQIELLEPNAKLTWCIEAGSYNEAMTLYHEKMGWEKYKPLD